VTEGHLVDAVTAGRPADSVHVVLPNDIDDPSAPSGGNIYDRRVCRGLAERGWRVHEHAVPGGWPAPSAQDRAGLARLLAGLPGGATVLADGLVASTVPEVLVPEAGRLRLCVLVHLPIGGETERAALASARAVITTSEWTRRELLAVHGLPADAVHVAAPGVDEAPVAPGSAAGSRLLCVAAVTPQKGHDLLAEALAAIADLPFQCVCPGSLDRDPEFAAAVRQRIAAAGIRDKVHFTGPLTGDRLAAEYAAADLLVLASRGETYGMVVTEALARGIPVVATAAGGVAEALGRAPGGSLPGILTEPGEPEALAKALRCWLTSPELRRDLKAAAAARRETLTGWAVTSAAVSRVLKGVAA
jgi:glycosyltransferase involved in cell wall biosynthesis